MLNAQTMPGIGRDYTAALAADRAARRLRVVAIIWIVLMSTLGVLAAIGLIGGIVTADDADARGVLVGALVGVVVWTTGSVLVGLAGIAVARYILARAPWHSG